MDFVVKLCENEHGFKVMNESNFIATLFDKFGAPGSDAYGFINSNMLLVGSKLYSIDHTLFDPFTCANFLTMLKSYLCDPINLDKPHLKDIGL